MTDQAKQTCPDQYKNLREAVDGWYNAGFRSLDAIITEIQRQRAIGEAPPSSAGRETPQELFIKTYGFYLRQYYDPSDTAEVWWEIHYSNGSSRDAEATDEEISLWNFIVESQ